MPVVFIALLVVGLDQFSKYLVEHFMMLHESVPVITGWINFTYILNKGAAFGIMENQRWFFLVIAIALFVIYFYFRKRLPKHPLVTVGVGLLLGGALGNALDRFIMGAVTDFIDLHFWPVFNVADMGIVIGVGLLLCYSWSHNQDRG